MEKRVPSLQRNAASLDHVRAQSSEKQASLFDTCDVSVCKVSASEKETVGLMCNIHSLVKNGMSLNKTSSLHSHVDDMLSCFDDGGTHTENECDQQIHRKLPCMSQTYRGSYSNWELVHSVNAVVEEKDVTMLKKTTL